MTENDPKFNNKTDSNTTGNKKGLGRGLSALLGEEAEDLKKLQSLKNNSRNIPIENIYPNPDQPRKIFNESELQNLANSLKLQGILQPIIVRENKNDKESFQIIAGERRWRAAQLAKIDKIPVIIKNTNDEEVLEIAIIENIQRENLNPLEEAEGYKRLLENQKNTQDKISKLVGKSRSHVANTIRLLNLPDEVKKMILEGKLSAGHGRALLASKNPIEDANKILNEGMNVRSTEKIHKNNNKKNNAKWKDANTLALEKDVSEALGYSVDIDYIDDNKHGTIKISFKNLDQLDDIVHRLLSPRE